jgi:putative outer membrane protein probably involved in nutrient binding
VFASGNHISLPEYKYLSPIYQKENGYAGVDSYRPMNSGLSARNNYQLSPYHRLDLGVNFYRYKKKGRMGIWNISIYNTYLKPNPFMTEVMVNQDINQRYQVVLQETILFYCMPSVSYTYKF